MEKNNTTTDMKTPEEIAQWVIDNRDPNKISEKTSDSVMYSVLVTSIKSMQEDAEKELIEFAKFIENKNVIEGNLVLHSIGYEGNLKPSNAHDLLTQFRKG